MRIVSLLPSATEIVFALDAGGLLIGRSHECDLPVHASSLPVVIQRTGPIPDPLAADSLVREAAAADQPLYTLDTGMLTRLAPDLILAPDFRPPVSASLREAAERIAARTRRAPRILALNPLTIEDILDDVLRVGQEIARADAAEALLMRLRTALLEAGDWVTPFAGHAVTVGFLVWTDPLVVAGHWTVQMIERAGGKHPWNETVAGPNAGAAAGPQQAQRTASAPISVTAEAFAAARPEIIVIAPVGHDLEQSHAAARSLLRQPWFRDLPAVRAGRLIAADGRAYFHRPGPRIVHAFRWMVGLVQNRPGWEQELPCRVVEP